MHRQRDLIHARSAWQQRIRFELTGVKAACQSLSLPNQLSTASDGAVFLPSRQSTPGQASIAHVATGLRAGPARGLVGQGCPSILCDRRRRGWDERLPQCSGFCADPERWRSRAMLGSLSALSRPLGKARHVDFLPSTLAPPVPCKASPEPRAGARPGRGGGSSRRYSCNARRAEPATPRWPVHVDCKDGHQRKWLTGYRRRCNGHSWTR